MGDNRRKDTAGEVRARDERGPSACSPVPESVVSAAKQAFGATERRPAEVAWLQEERIDGSVRTFRSDGMAMIVDVSRSSSSSRITVSVLPPSAARVELECAGPTMIGGADTEGTALFERVPFGPARLWVSSGGEAWARSEWFTA